MSRNSSFAYKCLVLVALFASSHAQADKSDEVPSRISQSSFMEGCLINAGKGNMNDIKNLASKFGPEAVLDLMFSSVQPVFQPALLTKSSEEPAKPVKGIEDMRENKYFQHAITSAKITAPWIKVTSDGRLIAIKSESEKSPYFNNWLRMPFVIPVNNKNALSGRETEPIVSGTTIQRY